MAWRTTADLVFVRFHFGFHWHTCVVNLSLVRAKMPQYCCESIDPLSNFRFIVTGIAAMDYSYALVGGIFAACVCVCWNRAMVELLRLWSVHMMNTEKQNCFMKCHRRLNRYSNSMKPSQCHLYIWLFIRPFLSQIHFE